MEFMKKRILSIFTILLAVIIIVGCASNKPLEQLSHEERFKRGQEFLEDKKYFKAQQEFQIVVLSGSHTELGDDAQFYLAESYFKNKEYILAISEFERLTRKMKYSLFVEQARWRICQAYVEESPKYYHDQSNTNKALQKLQEFIEEYPSSEYLSDVQDTIKQLRNKLAEKLIKSAVLYNKLHAFDSAIVAYQDLLSRYYDTDLADEAHVGIIEANIKLKKFDEAMQYHRENFDKITSPELKAKAGNLIQSINVEKS